MVEGGAGLLICALLDAKDGAPSSFHDGDLTDYNLLGNNGAFLPPLNKLNISSPIQIFLDVAMPFSTSATRPAWTNSPFPLASMPWLMRYTTASAISAGSLMGTPTSRILFAQSRRDSPGCRPEMMSVSVMPGATTETAIPNVAVSFLSALIKPTMPVERVTTACQFEAVSLSGLETEGAQGRERLKRSR